MSPEPSARLRDALEGHYYIERELGHQTVLFFPGSPALRTRSSDSLFSVGMFDFFVQGGRAVIYPVYKGTYERDDGTRFSDPDTTNRYRQHAIQWQQDVSRTVDYLAPAAISTRRSSVFSDIAGAGDSALWFLRSNRASQLRC